MHEERDIIQISGKYVVSIGAHWTHAYALIAKSEVLDYYAALEICDLLSFVFDSIVTVGVALRPKSNRNVVNKLRPYFKLLGVRVGDARELQQLVVEATGMLAQSDGGGMMMRAFPPGPRELVLGMDLPKTARLRDALFVYRQALVSVDPAGAILNYWRVLEASTTISQRCRLLDELFSTRLAPVWCQDSGSGARTIFNIIPRYKRLARRHYERLIARHGSGPAVMDFFYSKRRCPSAHAKRDVLRVEASSPLAELYFDSLLLKCLARLAIQKAWI
jgi:hypothetical protein